MKGEKSFVVEHQIHCQHMGNFSTEEEAKNEIRRLTEIPSRQ
jgi:hypothetical protein